MAELENVLDAFTKLTGLPVIWKSVRNKGSECGLNLSHTLHCNAFCQKVKSTRAGLRACSGNDTVLLPAYFEEHRTPEICRCHAGGMEIVVPIFRGSECAELLFAGPFRLPGQTAPKNAEWKSLWESLPELDREKALEYLNFLAAILPPLSEYKDRVWLAKAAGSIRDPRIRQAVQELNMHPERKIEIEPLAKAAFLSESRFIHLFRRETGSSVSEYVCNIRMDNAKKLLTETELPLSEIMARCGYADQSRFCRKFREHAGMPPGRYRNRYRKNTL